MSPKKTECSWVAAGRSSAPRLPCSPVLGGPQSSRAQPPPQFRIHRKQTRPHCNSTAGNNLCGQAENVFNCSKFCFFLSYRVRE